MLAVYWLYGYVPLFVIWFSCHLVRNRVYKLLSLVCLLSLGLGIDLACSLHDREGISGAVSTLYQVLVRNRLSV